MGTSTPRCPGCRASWCEPELPCCLDCLRTPARMSKARAYWRNERRRRDNRKQLLKLREQVAALRPEGEHATYVAVEREAEHERRRLAKGKVRLPPIALERAVESMQRGDW